MTEAMRARAIRILREQEIIRTNRNNLIRSRFGDRITRAYTVECAQRDDEIAAINATIGLLEKVKVVPA